MGSFKRAGCGQTLWEEIAETHKRRNAVIHRAEPVTISEAEHAVEIARVVLEELFTAVVGKLGLHTHSRLEVCGKKH